MEAAASNAANVSQVGDFENGADGQLMTTALVRAAFKGVAASSWDTCATFTSATPSAVSNVFFETDAARAPGQLLNANGTPISETSLRGMRCVMDTDGCILLSYQPPSSPKVGFFFRWNGPQINNSPRDIAMWTNYQGKFQGLQIYDGQNPWYWAHFQPVSGDNVGNPVEFQRNRLYWVEEAYRLGDGLFSVQFFDVENGLAPLEVSSGTVGGVTDIPHVFGIGALQYAAGGSQSVDFDNIVFSFDGSPLPRPTA